MPDAPTQPLASFRRWSRLLARGLFAFMFVGLPVLGMAGLAALWVRSHRVEETARLNHNTKSFDPITQVDRTGHAGLQVISSAGILALEVEWSGEARRVTDPDEAKEIQEQYEQDRTAPDPEDFFGVGWRWLYFAEEPIDPPVTDSDGLLASLDTQLPGRAALTPTNTLGLPRGDGLGHPLTYLAWTRSDQLTPHDTIRAVAPFWGWMLPLVAPVVWWVWCPSGRWVPRLTLRRALMATAGVALLLTLLVRSSPIDHAVLTLNEFVAEITYAPDPGGSGRPIPIAVSLDQTTISHSMTITPAYAARISRALNQLPILRDLDLSGTPGPPSIETAMLPTGRSDLETIGLRMSNADAATLARLADFPNLRRLSLTRSLRLDDASLAALRRLPNLTDLALGHLSITDAGLDHLHDLPNLRRLDFGPKELSYREAPSRLTTLALQRLADSLPQLESLTCPDGTVLRPRRRDTLDEPAGQTP